MGGCRIVGPPMTHRLRPAPAPAIVLGGLVLVIGLLVLAMFGPFGATVRAEDEAYIGVDALDDFYEPPVLRVPVGTTVEWEMAGRNPHTVTADDTSFDSGVVKPGGSYEQTFDQPGVYPYYCTLHGSPGKGMAGTIVVGDAPLPGGGGTRGRDPVPAQPGKTIDVPADQPSIQAAVDVAKPGDLVLVAPGTYDEGVIVLTPYLTIRGTDRNTVILEGGDKLANGIHVIEADGVTVENMTARHYQLNGFYWTGSTATVVRT
jgi:plastocyanin